MTDKWFDEEKYGNHRGKYHMSNKPQNPYMGTLQDLIPEQPKKVEKPKESSSSVQLLGWGATIIALAWLTVELLPVITKLF